MYEQTRSINTAVNVRPGYCLEGVRLMFGISQVAYRTATANWNASLTQHRDRNFPAGVAVPVWFSLAYEPAGHVALRMADGTVYSVSSPSSNKLVHHSSLDALIQYYSKANPLTYLGWTRDIENVAIIKEKNMAIPDTDAYYSRYLRSMNQVRGRDISKVGFPRDEFRKNIAGLPNDLKATEVISDNPEADTAHGWMAVGYTAVKDGWAGQIKSLTASLKAEKEKSVGLATNLNETNLKLDEALKLIAKLQAESTAQYEKVEVYRKVA